MFAARQRSAGIDRKIVTRTLLPLPHVQSRTPTGDLGRWSEGSARPRNELLEALPESDFELLRDHLEGIELKRRQVLFERNIALEYAYFIESGAASLLSRCTEGTGALELRTLGKTDFVGVPLVLGTVRSPYRCVVQIPGRAFRIRAGDLSRVMEESAPVRQLLMAYVQAAMVQSTQLLVCNTRHGLRERVTRWLLLASDRAHGRHIAVTHQAISRALGVRRASVTTTLGQLEKEGLVSLDRGQVSVRDRSGLEQCSCECSRVVRAEYDRLRQFPWSATPRRLSSTQLETPACRLQERSAARSSPVCLEAI